MGVASGSIGVLSEGIHSFLDLVSAAVSFFTVREAGKPADREHPFGHGKIETVSSLFESVLLLVAAALILVEALRHFRHPHPIAYQGLAIATIVVSIVVSYFVYRNNIVASRAAESSALRVNALHFLSDVVASAGVLIGLIILKLTGWLIVDAIVAFGVAGYILLITFQQVKSALLELTDTQLPDEEVLLIRKTVDEFRGRMIDVHDMRTRKVGAARHIDFHMTVCGWMTVEESHSVCDAIESRLTELFPEVSVNIHVEPCETHRAGCHATCVIHSKRRELPPL